MKIGKRIKPKEELLNCPNCSAPISGDRCDYCGTQFIDCTTIRTDKPFYLKFSPDGKNTIISKVFLEDMTVCMEQPDFCYGRDVDGVIHRTFLPPTRRFTATYVSVD